MESLGRNVHANEPVVELANTIHNAVLVLNSEIDSDCFARVLASLDSIGRQERLALVLDSPGGFIEDAFRIANAIRSQCNWLDVMVPSKAKSAATLIALSGNRILFGRFGELGPLDPQVPDLASGSGPRSPLEIVKGLEFLRTYYIETFDIIVRFLLPRAGMDVTHTFDHATGLLSPIASSLYQSVNYRELGEAARYLAVSEEYAEDTMRRWSPLEDDAVYGIVRQLVWEYPDHAYIIDIDEARSIGLSNVEQLDPQLESLCYEIIVREGLPVVAALPDNYDQSKGDDGADFGRGGEHENESGTSCQQ